MRILNQRKINNYNRTAFDTGTVIVSEYIPNIKSYFLEFVFDVGSRDERINGSIISHCNSITTVSILPVSVKFKKTGSWPIPSSQSHSDSR